MTRFARPIACAVGLACVLGLMPVARADDTGSPTKEDIIKALNSPVQSTTRGFVQVPGGAKPAPSVAAPASAHVAAPAAAGAAAASEHASIGVPVLFDVDSAAIKPDSKTTLDSIASALNSPSLKDAKILIEGHTDGTGSAERNQALSEERAKAVKDFLVQTGNVPAERLAAVGKGSSEPVDPAKPLSPENRRVVLVNLNN